MESPYAISPAVSMEKMFENVDGQTTDAGVIGTNSSGELKKHTLEHFKVLFFRNRYHH